jgi:hypothetical protein
VQEAMEAEAQALREAGATLVFMRRDGATEGVVQGASGGTLRSTTVTAANLNDLEEGIGEAKEAAGPGAPFFQVERNLPFTFTVTLLSQIMTAYYFLFFIVILPVLGLRETPNRVPDTIAKAVGGPAKQGA